MVDMDDMILVSDESEAPKIPAEPLPPARPPGGRRADADSAHRRLFGLLPSFLSSGIDEERLARSREIDTSEPQITPSPALAVTESMGAVTLPPDKLRKLQGDGPIGGRNDLEALARQE